MNWLSVHTNRLDNTQRFIKSILTRHQYGFLPGVGVGVGNGAVVVGVGVGNGAVVVGAVVSIKLITDNLLYTNIIHVK